ncbi:MAG: hypothetical protein EP350_09845, partial [Alphaproteobacteria bacterium]
MSELIAVYWPYLLIALAIGLGVGWFVFVANRRTSVTIERKDVLDEGAAPAQRNQVLIDSPGKIEKPSAAPQDTQSSASAGGDDLTRIKGLGPKIAALLNGCGVTRYAQIAEWDDAEIDRIDAQLDRFQGRIR